MKTKILPVLFVAIICVVLVVGCIPVGAYIGEVDPDDIAVFQPIRISVTDDGINGRGEVISMTSSVGDFSHTSEVFIYGDNASYYFAVYANSTQYLYEYNYWAYDEMGIDLRSLDCEIYFPDFHLNPSFNPANPSLYFPNAIGLRSASWYADISYYDLSGDDTSIHYADYTGFSDTSSTSIEVPLREIYALFSSYDYVTVANLHCIVETGSGSLNGITYTHAPEQIVALGAYLPPEIVAEYISPNLFDWIITPLDSFLNIQIVPPDPSGDFGGATMGGILALVIAIPMLIAFLKVFAGG